MSMANMTGGHGGHTDPGGHPAGGHDPTGHQLYAVDPNSTDATCRGDMMVSRDTWDRVDFTVKCHMSSFIGKMVFHVSDQVRHKPGCIQLQKIVSGLNFVFRK